MSSIISKRIRQEIDKRTKEGHFRELVMKILQFEVKYWRKNPNYKRELDRMLELHMKVIDPDAN